MGIKPIHLAPPQGPTTLNPPPLSVYCKPFSVARTDTTAKLVAVLPAAASIIDFDFYGPVSNAGTTATLSVGTTLANANELVNGQDVRTTSRNKSGAAITTAVPNLENQPALADIQLFAKYAETGAASSSGGPWIGLVWYIV